MAFLVSTLGDLYYNLRKGIACTGLALKETVGEDPTTSATFEAGTGVPSHAAPDGSGYLRKDATDGDDAFYVRVSGSWVPILGATA